MISIPARASHNTKLDINSAISSIRLLLKVGKNTFSPSNWSHGDARKISKNMRITHSNQLLNEVRGG